MQETGQSVVAKHGLLACCIMGVVIVAGWLLTSFLVLLR